ncbi:transglutaminase-like domain-containing protein [Allorhodopirellula solitaria]|uniref:Protein-glutamine gamma-glutamyltransferase n=1 Tax=Allorhodopirellula solitaria TaxID=2527987 RepID=A0A5C5XSC3_9BACT|nr:transglutaminase-like domain-containing protein [Allorhodopirellula solitaria]TWT66146.1 Protein-glutamine gamma-glutamyltransferase [Allorhodopirellula solitaria]
MTSEQTSSSHSLRLDNRVVLGAVILALAAFVGSTFATQTACLAMVVSAFLFGYLGEKWTRSRRARTGSVQATHGFWGGLWRGAALVLAIIGAFVLVILWRMEDRLSETSSLLILAVDMIAHDGIALLCILWAVWPRRGHVTMMVIALVTVLMAVAGGGVSGSRTAQTAVGLVTVIGFVLAAQVIVARQHSRTTSKDDKRLILRSETWPYLLLTLSLFLIVASTLVQVTDTVLPNVQAEVFAQLKDRFESPDTGIALAGGGYVSGGRLGSVQHRMLTNPTGIVLRGYCDNIPGYLRGNVFDSYSQRRWRTRHRWIERNDQGEVLDVHPSRLVVPSGPASVPLRQPGNTRRMRFPLNLAESGSDNRIFAGIMEIQGNPEKGPQTFLPSATMWIEARGERIGVTPHRLISKGLDTSQPWVAGVAMSTEHEILSEDARALMLSVDPAIRDEIARVAQSVCGDAQSPELKARRIAAHFQNNYLYRLQPPRPPRGVDPIIHFLNTKHAAHCELFASASTLMMRTLDVPARYVTGYVMDELSESQGDYLARNRDAHAWVEYYDDGQERWVALESTPGRLYRTLNVIHPELAAGTQGNSLEGGQSAALGWLRAQWGKLVSLRLTDALAITFRTLQLPLLIGLVLWLGWRRRGNRGDAQAAALTNARRVMDRRLRRWGWTRRGSETLHQFAARLESFSDDSGSEEGQQRKAELAQAARWYRRHAVALYGRHANAVSG